MSRIASHLAAAAATIVACIVAVPTQAQVIYAVDPTSVNIPGLAGFATTGADMSGLQVRAQFSGGANLDETLVWATTGPGAGGVFGTGWSLTLSGDSFTSDWIFDFDPNANLGQLGVLTLDGRDGLTIFDRTLPSTGTPGSSSGLDFDFAGGTCGACFAEARYGFETSIGAAPAVTDLYQTLTISFFGRAGPTDDWRFVQDTDNDSRFVPGIPEPETYALLLGGLGFVSWVAKRRRQPA